MEFCPECGGILLPKRGTSKLLCRICNKTYDIKEINPNADENTIKKEYRIVHKRSRTAKAKTVVLDKDIGHQMITEEDRKAFEDYFATGQD